MRDNIYCTITVSGVLVIETLSCAGGSYNGKASEVPVTETVSSVEGSHNDRASGMPVTETEQCRR